MFSQAQLEVLKQAAEILKEELVASAPATPEEGKVRVKIHKFGTFMLKKMPSRKVTNPALGGEVTVPERLVIKFSPSKTWLPSR